LLTAADGKLSTGNESTEWRRGAATTVTTEANINHYRREYWPEGDRRRPSIVMHYCAM